MFISLVNVLIILIQIGIIKAGSFQTTEQFEPCDWPVATDGFRTKSKIKTTIGAVNFFDPICPPGFLDTLSWTSIVMQQPTTCYTYTACQLTSELSPDQIANSFIARKTGNTGGGGAATPVAAPAVPKSPAAINPSAAITPVAAAVPAVVPATTTATPALRGAFPW